MFGRHKSTNREIYLITHTTETQMVALFYMEKDIKEIIDY